MAGKPTFAVELTDGTTHTVEVLHGDQLRAELEGPKHMLNPNDPRQALHTTTLWVWAALVRTQVVEAGFQEFKDTVAHIARGSLADQPVDPTSGDQGTAVP